MTFNFSVCYCGVRASLCLLFTYASVRMFLGDRKQNFFAYDRLKCQDKTGQNESAKEIRIWKVV